MKENQTGFTGAVKHSDIWVRLSTVFMGAGYFARGQIIKGIIITVIEILFFAVTFGFSMQYIMKLPTLGTVQREEYFDAATLQKTVNDYDNSLMILLCGIIGTLLIVAFIALYIHNMRSVYHLQLLKEEKKHINSFREDLNELLGNKFHITLLTFPGLGVLLVNVIPIIFLICIAFTNYDIDHQPPTYLFTWVGFRNFKTLFTSSSTVTFGYVFIRIFIWTLIWALTATFTTYFGGIFLAKFINDKRTKAPKLWRTLFVITIAIPQFVTLLLVSKMFSDYGIVNAVARNTGILSLFKELGLVGEAMSYVPFLSRPGWVHVMVILINIWVGVPYQMLIATGVLMNIPEDQLESARLEGATEKQIFLYITMPYMLFVTGPSLITSIIANINNFNVIYLLTNDYVTTNMKYANSNAKEADLLITWLFTLTNNYSDYKMASVIGIFVFLICAALTILSFAKLNKNQREEMYQ